MGKRLNISQTTVIQTELIPLTDNFELIPNGLTEQWFYENTNVFKPDRQITPLIITPKVTAVDEDTHITYQPSLYIVQWYALEYNGTAWVETEINNITQGLQYDYVLVDGSLQVNKNISDAAHGVQIKCIAQYSDPRDSGIVYAVEETVSLTANKDATVIYPTIDILNESAQSYNPLGDRSSQFTFKGTANWDGVPNPSENIIKYAVDPKGTEAIIPDNESALVTSAPAMDIRYGKGSGSVLKEDQQFMYRRVSGGTVSPIGSNLAYVEKIKGNTVKWNQVFTPYNGSVTANGITISGDGSGKITIIANSPSRFNQVVKVVKNIISGHKYLCRGWDYSTLKMEVYNNTFFPSSSGRDYWILTAQQSGNCTMNIYAPASLPNGTYYIYPQLFDLTLIYGAGNEPTTDAAFKSWLSRNIGLKSYYPYNAGELIPVNMSAIKSVGFNLWDEVWENGYIDGTDGQNRGINTTIRSKNYIPVTYGNTYYFRQQYTGGYHIFFYDINKSYLGYTTKSQNTTFTLRENTAYIRFYFEPTTGTKTYNNSVCINLSDASRNGTYEAHWEAEQYLPITELKGKVNGTGDSVVIFPNGMNHVGDVYDEIKVDGGVIKAIKRFGRANLKDMLWNINNFGGIKGFNTSSLGRRVLGVMCDKYITKQTGSESQMTEDKTLYFGHSNDGIVIKDSTYNDYTATQFKAAMDGVYIIYQLGEELTYIIDDMPRGQFEWYGVKNGTEVKIDTLPCYVSGQHTDTVVVDAMYSENLAVILRIKELAGDLTCLPPRAQRTVAWRTPNVDSIITSDKGGAVRSDSDDFTFGTIVNTQGQTLSDEKINANLRFKWSTRKSNGSTVTQRGWGRNITLQKADLINVRGVNNTLASTHVDNEVYLLGAYEEVIYDGETLTYSGSPLFGRQLDEEN